MKITKSYLKQVIKEEITRIVEEEDSGGKQVANFQVEYSAELGGSAQEDAGWGGSGPFKNPTRPPVFLAKITRVPMKDEMAGVDLPQIVFQIYKVPQKPGKYKNKEGRPTIEAYHENSTKGTDFFAVRDMKGFKLVSPEATPEELQKAVDTVTSEISLKTTPRTAQQIVQSAALRFSPRASDQRAYKVMSGGNPY